MKLYDAHNHLQDDRFGGSQAELMAACVAVGVNRMVVNGSSEADWPQVMSLARAHPQVIPSFGYHPWHVGECSPRWQKCLAEFLETAPSGVGEIGLDRWKPGLDYRRQEEVFLAQLALAAARERPVSIHCLRAWGRLLELLRQGPPLRPGFLLHSYGGPVEMVPAFVKLGAYFGFPGYFLQPRKARQRDTFRAVPVERVLMETDAPDQWLPDSAGGPDGGAGETGCVKLADPATGRPLNHPANLPAVYAGFAAWLGRPVEEVAGEVEENFLRLFGAVGAEIVLTRFHRNGKLGVPIQQPGRPPLDPL